MKDAHLSHDLNFVIIIVIAQTAIAMTKWKKETNRNDNRNP